MQESRIPLFLTAFLTTGMAVNAAVTLPHYITDNMIVQQNSVVKIKGESHPASEVKVKTG